MIQFKLNGIKKIYEGDVNLSLLKYLRNTEKITSVKDGCSCQSACGACMVEINGKAKLSCVSLMKTLDGANIITMEGIPDKIRDVIAKAYVEKGAVQCGFCIPGFIMRTKVLLQENQNPTRKEIAAALNQNLCRCTGYVKIIDAIELAFQSIRENKTIEFSDVTGKIGKAFPKYQAYETAIGKRDFVGDLQFENMLHGALKFSDHPRAKVLKINVADAEKYPGVIKIFTAKDVSGNRFIGLINQDWPLMIAEGEITRYIGDVLAGVVAESEDIAREAAKLIHIEYEIYEPVTDPYEALKDIITVQPNHSNLLDNCIVRRGGDADESLKKSAFVAKGFFQTQRIEHGFLECEGAVAMPLNNGVHLYSNGQGIYVDQIQCAKILGISEEKVRVTLVPTGGGFGGKEDMTVQGHVCLFAYLLKRTVRLVLSREESITMHPKRHPVFMDMEVGCDAYGKFTALKLRAVGDSGAYASVGAKVMERVAGHATSGYHMPIVDLEAKTVYTNNIPSGAMRGFGANQVCFAIESCIDELCEKAGFDRWQFRYDNALVNGSMTATGQVLDNSVGIRECLLALKDKFYQSKFTGIATGIKNSGVGNGMLDYSDVKIIFKSLSHIEIHHGWTEMGQGIHNMAIQTFCEETGLDPKIIDVFVDTEASIPTGMTTSSRATALLGNAIIDATKTIRNDLQNIGIEKMIGKTYIGRWECNWTTKPGANVDKVITHFAYGYAAQLCVLNEQGKIETIYAAHDAGKIMNPVSFEGQVQGAVLMGIGYALTEDLPMKDGRLLSKKLRDCKIIKAKDIPEIVVIGVEKKDTYGPYGAKGLGEIGLVPTAAAVANALYQFDKIRRYKLPMDRH